VVVIPGIREKSKKTRRHEKRYWTHRDQQQDVTGAGVNVNYQHPQSISATRDDAIGLVQRGYNTFSAQCGVQW
jgi:hypothetical protein